MRLDRLRPYSPLVLRIGLGITFVRGGLKLALAPDPAGLAAAYLDQSKGYIAAPLADYITQNLGLQISTLLQIQGWVEIALGLLVMAGLFTTASASLMGLMYWSFTVANPVVGAIRLSRDVALMGLSFTMALVGGGRWSLDEVWLRRPGRLTERVESAALLLRLSLAFTLLTSTLFTGGLFDNPLNTTLPRALVFLCGLLLVLGVLVRPTSLLISLWLGLIIILPTLWEEGLYPGLDSIKREIALLSGASVLILLGAGWFRALSCLSRKSATSEMREGEEAASINPGRQGHLT